MNSCLLFFASYLKTELNPRRVKRPRPKNQYNYFISFYFMGLNRDRQLNPEGNFITVPVFTPVLKYFRVYPTPYNLA
jgi:hypothetical protein